MTTKQIDYYGEKDNYIHLKFGDCVKHYNFIEDFVKKYPQFVKAYTQYFEGENSEFENAFQIVSYVFNNEIPVHFYFNFTDTPAESRDEIMDYLIQENDKEKLYEADINS